MGLFRKIEQLFGSFASHDGVIVLTYHRINDDLPAGPLVVRVDEFRKQMAFMHFYRHKFEVVWIGEMIDYLDRRSESIDRRPKTKILITFDDGYRDNRINAFPVLKKYGFPAVIFLTAGLIDNDPDYLASEQIKEMTKNGIAFGAHTMTHPRLTQISAEKAKREIGDSIRYVRPEAVPFCYPYGDFDGNVKNLVKGAGASCAFSVKPGINYKGQDLFEIKRIDILGQDNFSSFKYKITDKYAIKGVGIPLSR